MGAADDLVGDPSAPSLIRNQGFRRLWLGDAISLLGDWFTYVAVGTLIVEGEHGLLAVAVLLIGHSLPRAVCAPLAGRLADRFDRRAIMILASLARALAVVAMIVAARAGALAVLQVLVFVRMAIGAFVDPASIAMLPQLVGREQVGRANAIIAATWSVMFGVGVVAGGAVTALAGPVTAMVVDGLTFLAAAAVFASLPRALPGSGAGEQARVGQPEAGAPREQAGVGQPEAGAPRPRPARAWALARADPEVLHAALAKAPALLANGGAWVLLHHIAAAGQFGATAVGLGALHAARAIGTGLGPLLWMGRLRASVFGLRAGTALTLIAVGLFAVADSPALALAAAGVWGFGLGATWVTATTRMQTLTANDELGRVASVDLVAHSLAACVGGLLGAVLADQLARPELAGWAGVAGGLAAWASVELVVRWAGRGAARVAGA